MMWIKASGTWLAHAKDADLFVPVHLPPLLNALAVEDPRAEKSVDFVDQSQNPNGLRPSIETTVHAVLPQKVVVHVHCVSTIAVAIQRNAEALFEELLDEFNWLWVPYLRPGLPLSKYISSTMASGVEVVILGNHGLVVAADSVQQAEYLLARARSAVSQSYKSVHDPDLNNLQRICANTEYEPAEDLAAHAIAMDDAALTVAAGGSLYPDHVIFLGEGSTIATDTAPIMETATLKSTNGALPLSIIVPGAGVLMHKDANDSQKAMAKCLSDVCLRVSAEADINYLNAEELYQLLNWEAETYRQSLASSD